MEVVGEETEEMQVTEGVKGEMRMAEWEGRSRKNGPAPQKSDGQRGDTTLEFDSHSRIGRR